jgi:glycerol-3-phosphate dehydrogenase
VIGGGVVGAASAHALTRRGVSTLVLEAEREPALGASGTNSGIVHTGFDSPPGELETELILRAGELRLELFEELGVPLRRCGALLAPLDAGERETVSAVAEAATRNGVETELDEDGSLSVPGESVTDPVAYTRALLAAAQAGGAELRTAARVEAIARTSGGLEPWARAPSPRWRRPLSCYPWTAAWSRAATTPGARPPTSAGARS